MRLTRLAALIGVPIGLPGAAVSVGIDAEKDVDHMGSIKMAGPLANLGLGMILAILSVIFPPSLASLQVLFMQGAGMNFMLGLFNMIPKEFKGFALDGKYIFKWKKSLYFGMFLGLLAGYIVAIIFTP